MISKIKNTYRDLVGRGSDQYAHSPLNGDEHGLEDEAFLREKAFLRTRSERKGFGNCCIFLSLAVFLTVWTLFMSLAFRYQYSQMSCKTEPPESLQIYSPLEEAVEWEYYKYNAGLFGQKTEYMGQPTNKTNDLWLDIVEHGMVAIPEEEALKVHKESTEWEDKPGYHMFGTEMYHQLHCLNSMRVALWKEVPDVMYGHEGEGAFAHLDHCIDYLRQTLLCHGDVHLIPLAYDKELGHTHPRFDTVHSCKKYEPIVRWVDEHQAGDVTPNGVGPPSGLHVGHGDHDEKEDS